MTAERVRHRAAAPTAMERIAELVGEEAANTLAVAFGGRRLYIPHQPGEAHPISAAIGLDAARRLAAREGGEYLEMPLSASKRARIIALRGAGMTIEAVRKTIGCTRRHVFKVLETERDSGPSDQLKLL